MQDNISQSQQPEKQPTVKEVLPLILRDLTDYIRDLEKIPAEEFELSRAQLTFIMAKSSQAEEILDAGGARRNSTWFPFRETVALIKNFSTAAYELLHVYFSSKFYTQNDAGDASETEKFQIATKKHLCFITELIRRALLKCLNQAEKLGITMEPRKFEIVFQEVGEMDLLTQNRRPSNPDSVKHRVDVLAISVLNTTEDVKNFTKLSKAKVEDWNRLDFDFLCETKFQSMKVNMHVLQSMYDTYISGSDLEGSDPYLRRVRGRISGTLHLLRIASTYIHYYERHIGPDWDQQKNLFFNEEYDGDNYISCRQFYGFIISYLAFYIAQFLMEARRMCQDLLQRYCVTKSVEVRIPPYVGFHVRPSTLVAAISLHYGSGVKLHIGEVGYDASSFPNIIMANNYLDQKKRAFLLNKLNEVDFSEYDKMYSEKRFEMKFVLRHILVRLASMNIVKIYRTPLDLDNIPQMNDNETLQAYTFRVIVHMMNNDRQLGIIYNTTVIFSGPEQAVNDIAVLAAANYCETETGEDLPLPKQLDYLNFKRNR